MISSLPSSAGLDISRFCFSNEEDFVESLLKDNVQLFLTTDRDEVVQASHKGQEVNSLLSFTTENMQKIRGLNRKIPEGWVTEF